MESRQLNLAHQQHRRAEVHLQNNRYDEAMQCHHNAAELLLDAMKSTTSSVALESITLQHSYHLKQKDFIKIKKGQYERVTKAMDHLKLLGKDPKHNLQVNDSEYVQATIYKTINEADSLLSNLRNTRKNIDQDPVESNPVESNLVESNPIESNESVKKVEVDGKKTEKSRETVVEELQILNNNLRSLVERLVFQVEVFKDENMTLKERVIYLEKERTKYLIFNIPSSHDDGLQSNFLNTNIQGDEVSKELTQKVPITKEPQQGRPLNTGDRIGQPHFDLSALKTSSNSV
ncbi:unnamed protein product [Arctia plantaginis]|uniref:Nuclear receptor-binding factor 2 MIT domain-containing protein n=1 Tax=Arctia plantaginis TaxID=874455 RepID=A0A8S1B809_ARCPL|nr:unnamed protein product [Arctia plantaginis]CAB3254791.1 unnamed protein product [Arctia plantaginis]